MRFSIFSISFRCMSMVVFVLLLGSCASMQKIKVETQPPGATIKIHNEIIGMTPTVVKLSKKKTHEITLVKDGYASSEVEIKKSFNPLNVFKYIGYVLLGVGAKSLEFMLDGQITNGEAASGAIAFSIVTPIALITGWATGDFNSLKPKRVQTSLEAVQEKISQNENGVLETVSRSEKESLLQTNVGQEPVVQSDTILVDDCEPDEGTLEVVK